MAKVSFTDTDKNNSAPEAPAARTELLPPEENAVVPNDFFRNANSGVEGAVDKSMVKVPWVSLVHGVGDLSTKFDPGQLVLNGETVLPEEMTAIFLRTVVYFQQKPTKLQEKKLKAEEKLPARFKTMDDARSAGFIHKKDAYRLDADPEALVVENAADMDVLLECPANRIDDLGVYFPIDIGNGKQYLIAKIRCKGRQFALVTEKLITTVSFNASKKLGSSDFMWKLFTKQGKEGDNDVHRMHISLQPSRTPAEVKEFFASF